MATNNVLQEVKGGGECRKLRGKRKEVGDQKGFIIVGYQLQYITGHPSALLAIIKHEAGYKDL